MLCKAFKRGIFNKTAEHREKVEQNHIVCLIRTKEAENKYQLDDCHMVQNMTDSETMLNQSSKMNRKNNFA